MGTTLSREGENLEFIVAGMEWSFSRLNGYYSNCKYEWYQHYIECVAPRSSFFASYGKFIHSILEKYAKGELSIFDISQYYEDHFYEDVPEDAPPNKYKDIKSDYYARGLEYLDNIDFDFDQYDILGVEKEIHFKIDDYKFIGFIDLLLRDKEDGKLVLCDHKSSSIKILKSGKVSKTDEAHFLEFKRQQYLYSKAVMEEYGENSVKELRWNMFKDRTWLSTEWKRDEYEEACRWALDTIHAIENEEEWVPSPEMWYCNFLCQIPACPYRV